VNIKKAFESFYGVKAGGMAAILNALGIPLEGRHHSGIDDCRNISSIVKRMIKDGARLQETQSAITAFNIKQEPVPKYSESAKKIDCFVVLDFEATCSDNSTSTTPQEVIEFPSILVDANTRTVVSVFQVYVKPIFHPQISKFCTELTGITQEQVDAGIPFLEAMKKHKDWLDSHVKFSEPNFTFVTCGDWDLKTMLPMQCSLLGEKVPQYFKNWVNLKIPFSQFIKCKKVNGMTDMLAKLNLELIGRHHSGIDDCKNIARILIELLTRGATINETWKNLNT